MSNFRVARLNRSTIDSSDFVDTPLNLSITIDDPIPVTTVEETLFEFQDIPASISTSLRVIAVAQNLSPGVAGDVTLRLYVSDRDGVYQLVSTQPRSFIANGETMIEIPVGYTGDLVTNSKIRLTMEASANSQFVLTNCFQGVLPILIKEAGTLFKAGRMIIDGINENNPTKIATGLGPVIVVFGKVGIKVYNNYANA